MINDSIYFLPMFALIIHNIEEALWLPKWSKYAVRFHKEVKSYEFCFAVLIITALGLLATSFIMLFPTIIIFKYIYFGFYGMMIFNAFFPHLISTIVLKKYAPGTVTAFLLNVPINLIVIIKTIESKEIGILEVIISAFIIGIVILLLLPLLFKAGKIVSKYN